MRCTTARAALLFLKLCRFELEGGGVFAGDADGLWIEAAAVARATGFDVERDGDFGAVLRGEVFNADDVRIDLEVFELQHAGG